MSTLVSDLWEKIASELNGTCDSLHSVLEYYGAEHLEDDMQFLQYLDNEIFQCATCGWWSPISEASNNEFELVCIDCIKYEEDLKDED